MHHRKEDLPRKTIIFTAKYFPFGTFYVQLPVQHPVTIAANEDCLIQTQAFHPTKANNIKI